jgi:hypothetical protein
MLVNTRRLPNLIAAAGVDSPQLASIQARCRGFKFLLQNYSAFSARAFTPGVCELQNASKIWEQSVLIRPRSYH